MMTMTMSLKDKVLARKPKTETVNVEGDDFLIVGKSRRDRGVLFAKARNKKDGQVDSDKLEGLLLAACVCDPETKEPLLGDFRDWDGVDSAITGPLVAHIMRICGLDKQDFGPKDSDSTES